jgi:hypothetical protein
MEQVGELSPAASNSNAAALSSLDLPPWHPMKKITERISEGKNRFILKLLSRSQDKPFMILRLNFI